MKLNKVFILILATVTVANGADSSRRSIQIVNNYGYPLELEIQRVKRETVGGVVGTSTTSESFLVDKSFTIYDLDDLVFVGFRQQARNARFERLDISDRDKHPNETLKITISAGYMGWGAWRIDRQWVRPAQQFYAEGIEFEWLDEELASKPELPKDAIPLDYERAYEKFVQLFTTAKNDGRSLAELIAMYKAFALIYHPDKGGRNEQFQALQNAFRTVKGKYR